MKVFPYNVLLVTGGAGFVGSNLAIYFKNRYPITRVIALDNLKRRGSEFNIERLKDIGIEFIHGDIRNTEDLDLDCAIDLILDCSAEPSVIAGYGSSPEYLIKTNLTGTINCLELARRKRADIIFFSTSRVYPYGAINSIKTLEMETRFEWENEQHNILGWSTEGIDVGFTTNGPKSMYGATKLCSEIILQEYIKMYALRGVINRCGVIAGPWQFGKVDQGVFTLWMLAHYFKKDLQYIGHGGKGKQVRDLLHIDDLFDLVNNQALLIDKISGNVYNVGGGTFSTLSLLEATMLCRHITNNTIKIQPEINDRPADLKIYITDNNKVTKDLSWMPHRTAHDILADIFKWIRENEKKIRKGIDF